MNDTKNITGRMRAAFVTTPPGDDRWQAVLDVLHANGYRRCAEGQRTTQWCDRANKAEAMIARLTGDLRGANRECEVRQERELGYLARAESAEAEVKRMQEYIRERELIHAQSLDAAVAEVERLRSALETLVNRCNTDFMMATDEANIAAEAALERAYLAVRGES